MRQLYEPEVQRLSNGIPVILQHLEGPAAATYWWVKTGSVDERPKESGFAHFLEHMLFKDAAAKETGLPSSGQMARAIEGLGGDINAYTAFDQTVFHVTCAAAHWERVIDSFGKMARPQKFLKADFEREKEVILEEIKKNEDSPGRQFFQSMFSLTFKKHPYGRPVIGNLKTLHAARVADLETFYRRNYVPNRMGLVVVGPLESEQRKKRVLRLLEKRFGSSVLRAGSTAFSPVKTASEPVFRKGPEFLVRAFDVQAPTVGLSLRMPDLLHEDVPALDCVAGVLGMGELSWLYRKLFYEKKLATEVSGALYVPRDPGMMYFQAELHATNQVNDSVREMVAEMARLKKDGPSSDELARIVTNAESERLYATQSADGMASRLGFLQFGVGDLSFDEKYIARLREISPERIREVASQYLDCRRLGGVVLVPRADASFDANPLAEMVRQGLFVSEEAGTPFRINRKKPKGSRGDLETFTTSSGIRVAYLYRPQSHVFSVHAAVLAGLRAENPSNWGISHLLSSTWTKGTSTKDSRTISLLVEGHAAGLDGFSGRNSMGLSVTGLQRDWVALSSLFTEVLISPQFPEDEIEHSRRVTEDSLKSLEDHSAQLCSKYFLETLYERHPYGKLNYGTLETISRLRQEELLRFHREKVTATQLVVSLSGPVQKGVFQKWVDELDRVISERVADAPNQASVAPLADEPDLKGPRWIERSLDREQDHILIGGLGVRLSDEDRHPMRLLQTILGGQSGRLFLELRENRSLAYSVSPIFFEGIERGYAGIYIASSPEKRTEAIQGIRAVLTALAEKGPTLRELKRAVEFYLGRRAMDLQSDPTLAGHFGLETLYGIPRLSDEEVARRMHAITVNDVRRVCEKYFVKPHLVTALVG